MSTAATLGKAVKTVGKVGGKVHVPRTRRLHRKKPGASPGINLQELSELPSSDEPVCVTVIDYGPEQVQTTHVDDVDAFLATPRAQWTRVRWINVDGLTNMHIVRSLAEHYNLHPLAIEDVLHVHQRPKVDTFTNGADERTRLYIVARMMQIKDDHLNSDQVSMFLGRHTVITFQQRAGDVWDPIRQRIDRPGSMMRNSDASYLLYALLDAVVDYGFPILDYYSDRLESLEDRVLAFADEDEMRELHDLKHQMLLLRREIWPLRDVINTLQRDESGLISDTTRLYLHDVYDHAVQVIDLVETYRDLAANLRDVYMTAISNRMNEVMKVLTIIATIFIPITFLAGVYGMNFKWLPEYDWKWSYPTFWGVCLGLTAVQIYVFKRRKWL